MKKKITGPTLFDNNSGKRFQFSDPEPLHKLLKITPNQKNKQQPCSSSVQPGLSSQPSTTLLQVEIDLLKIQISKLQLELSSARQKFSYRSVKSDDALVEHYTGLPSAGDFDVLLQLCERFDFSYYCKWKVKSTSTEDQLFITLMKIRCNLSNRDLAFRYAVSTTTISNITTT